MACILAFLPKYSTMTALQVHQGRYGALGRKTPSLPYQGLSGAGGYRPQWMTKLEGIHNFVVLHFAQRQQLLVVCSEWLFVVAFSTCCDICDCDSSSLHKLTTDVSSSRSHWKNQNPGDGHSLYHSPYTYSVIGHTEQAF